MRKIDWGMLITIIISIGSFAFYLGKLESRIKPGPPGPPGRNGQDIPVGTILSFAAGIERLPPENWLFCDGQSLSRTTYGELFSVIGTTFDVQTSADSFCLPDLRGKTILGAGEGSIKNPGDIQRQLTRRVFGEELGYENHVLTLPEMPNHSHGLEISRASNTGNGGVNNEMAAGGADGIGNRTFQTHTKGGASPHNNMQPSLILNYVIKAR